MTLHSAKGLEFDAVYLAGLEEGLLPHSRSANSHGEIEEERRLFYVGMTRAKKTLVISRAIYRRSYGEDRLRASLPSRFLAEIPASSSRRRRARTRSQGRRAVMRRIPIFRWLFVRPHTNAVSRSRRAPARSSLLDLTDFSRPARTSSRDSDEPQQRSADRYARAAFKYGWARSLRSRAKAKSESLRSAFRITARRSSSSDMRISS